MPRKRNPENEGLPDRWRVYHGAYYYQVPPGLEPYWDHRKQYRLGDTYDEAMREFMRRLTESEQAEDVPGKNLLSEQDIVDASVRFQGEGVYFLIKDNKIVYVGRSSNVAYRISKHASNSDMAFDRIHFIPATGIRQIRLEQLYIHKFKPENNVYHTESVAHPSYL